ncbi:MAG: hypothetical protein CHACPFDD_00670 [Phycisphaerae bacterium]|nr:hypothetical protein [Phycisphaerae bacterium]
MKPTQTHPHRGAFVTRLIAALALTIGPASTAVAQLQIELEYDWSRLDCVPPSYDPDGERLQVIMETAAKYWEDCFPSVSETIEIRYYWTDIVNPGDYTGPLAWLHNWLDNSDQLADTLKTSLTARKYRIRFDTIESGSEIPWFVDDTPWEHSEFWMAQTVYQSLTATEQGDYFGGSPPDNLEVAFGLADAVPEWPYGPEGLQTQYDLYRTALHEIGHALGFADLNKSTGCSSTDHGFVEIDSSLIGGADMCVRVAWEDKNGDGDISRRDCDEDHIAAPSCMHYTDQGIRNLPTGTEVLAIASENGWTTYTTPRANYVHAGGGPWNLTTNWYPHASGPTVDAMIVDSSVGQVYMNVSGWARSLWVWNSNTLRTQNFLLDVTSEVNVQAGTLHIEDGGVVTCRSLLEHGGTVLVDHLLTPGTLTATDQIIVGNDSVLEVGGRVYANDATLTIWDAGLLQLSGGTVDAGTVIVRPSASERPCDLGGAADGICGGGTIQQVEYLENNGNISPLQADLHFVGGAAAVFDLDGSRDVPGSPDPIVAYIRAAAGNIYFENANILDDYQGAMYIDAPNQIYLTGITWSIGDGGTLVFDDAVLPYGTVAGLHAETTFLHDGSSVTVTGATDALFGCGLFVSPGSTIDVGGVSTLVLGGETNYFGGSVIGTGTLDQQADAHVWQDQAIGVSKYNWDGEQTGGSCASCAETVVHAPATFRILGEISANPDGYDGQVIVESGATLIVDNAWVIDPPVGANPGGRLSLAGGAAEGAEITNDGTIGGIGSVRAAVVNHRLIQNNAPELSFEAPLELNSGSTLNVGALGLIVLRDQTDYYGATVNGPGKLIQVGDADVWATQVIAVATYDWDGEAASPIGSTTTIHNGGTLRILGAISALGDGYDGHAIVDSGGKLVVVNSWQIDPPGIPGGWLELTGGVVDGPPGVVLTNYGTISGYGEIKVPVVNYGTITCDAAGLTFTGGLTDNNPGGTSGTCLP